MAIKTNNIVASGPTLIKKGTASPSRVTSPPQVRSGKIPAEALAKDLESLSNQINQLHGALASTGQSIDHFILHDQQGNIVGILGSEVYQGQYVTNWLKELHIGGTPFAAQLNADGSGNLNLVNATITLTTPAGTITLDPTVPNITVTSPMGTIVIDATVPNIVVKDHLGATVVRIGVDGSGNGVVILNGAVLNGGGFAGGFTGTAIVRNAAGTGTSAFTFSNGGCTGFTP